MTRRYLLFVALALSSVVAGPGFEFRGLQAQDAEAAFERTGLPLPRFASLRASEVNLRRGPGERYPIEWVYRRRGLPIEIIDEFESWRRIRDHDGTIGWIHRSMLRGQRTVLVLGNMMSLRRDPDAQAPAVARLEPGVVARLETCRTIWCRVETGGYSGWLRRQDVYGLYPGESYR
jgi:SH3-like domain-containing protein